MQNETISNSNYDFFYFGGTDNSYAFETINEISYEVKFKSINMYFRVAIEKIATRFEFYFV